MSPAKFKEIREKLGLTQKELAALFGLSGAGPISHFEIDFRTPSPLIAAVMSYMDGLSEKKAREFLEDFGRHMDKVQKTQKGRKRD